MPTFAGQYMQEGGRVRGAWPRSGGVETLVQQQRPGALDAQTPPLGGNLVSGQPTPVPAQTLAGSENRQFQFDYYYHVTVTPANLNLGNLVSQSSTQIELWNSNLFDVTLQSIAEVGTDGLQLTGQPNPPLVLKPLQSLTYTLIAQTNGAPIIDASFTFNNTTDEDPVLAVTGRRVVVFNARPNWASGVTERWTWKTAVIEAHDGTEQRIKQRRRPRRGYEYQTLSEGRAVRAIESILHAWSSRVYALPIWMDASSLLYPIAAGDTTLQVQQAALKDYQAGGILVLWQSETNNEAVEIDSITVDTITLRQPASQDWPAGTRVYPGRFARLQGRAQFKRQTDTIQTGRFRFELDDADDFTLQELTGMETYQGYPVIPFRPNRGHDQDASIERALQIVDNLIGARSFDDRTRKPITRRAYEWQQFDRQSIHDFRRWLYSRAGRLRAYWQPSGNSDLILTQLVAETDTAITVENIGVARYMDGDPLRQNISIETTQGTFYRAITGTGELSDDEEILSIDTPLGVTIHPEDVIRISWLNLRRDDQDRVELHWETDSAMRTTITSREVTQ